MTRNPKFVSAIRNWISDRWMSTLNHYDKKDQSLTENKKKIALVGDRSFSKNNC